MAKNAYGSGPHFSAAGHDRVRPARPGTEARGLGDPFWSWTHIQSHDVQDDHLTIAQQVGEVTGDGVHRTRVNDPAIYDLYCSVNALHRYEPPQ